MPQETSKSTYWYLASTRFLLFKTQSKPSQLTLITFLLVNLHHFRIQAWFPLKSELWDLQTCNESTFLVPQLTQSCYWTLEFSWSVSETLLACLAPHRLSRVEAPTKSFWTSTGMLVLPELLPETWKFPIKCGALFTWPTCRLDV